jgi:hypothetical protein
MSKTKRLGLPYILQAQAQKEVTHNQALNMLDIYVNTVAQDIVDVPPTNININDGDIYIINTDPKDIFNNHASKLAQYINGNWSFHQAFNLMEVMVRSTRTKMVYDNNIWTPLESAAKDVNTINPLKLISKDTGEYLQIGHFSEDLKLAGKVTTTSNILPDHSLVIAVNIRVLENITGSPSFAVGVREDPSRYGDKINITKDTTNIGMSYHPVTYYHDTPIVITPDKDEFVTGLVRITAQYFKSRGAWDW